MKNVIQTRCILSLHSLELVPLFIGIQKRSIPDNQIIISFFLTLRKNNVFIHRIKIHSKCYIEMLRSLRKVQLHPLQVKKKKILKSLLKRLYKKVIKVAP